MTRSDSKQASKRRFGRFAEAYVSSPSHARGSDLERLLEIASPEPGWRVLDIATGGGHTALRFAPHVAEVVASDLTPRMLEKARLNAESLGVTNLSFREADAENLPFETGSFDLVTCRIAAHHFPDVPRFVREAARVLRPGACLLVQDHVLPEDRAAAQFIDAFERLRDPSHNQAYSEGAWRDMFQAAGLAVEQVQTLTKRHALLPWAERQGCRESVVTALQSRLLEAAPAAADWMLARNAGRPEASFVNHHLIIAGRKAATARSA